MKSALILIGTGLAIVVVSSATWALTATSVVAGDATAIERALTEPAASSPPAEQPAPSTTTPLPAEPSPLIENPPAAPSPTVPQFTIGEQTQGHTRMPVGIRIPALDQEAPINPAGVESNGDMEVPDNVTDVAWYKYGSAPGEPGSAVLAAHVDLAGQGPGVFFELRELEPGSEIIVEFDDGTTETYIAEARAIYDKAELPTDAIFSREGPPVLTLITCGGGFNERVRRYDSNVVVYAVPDTSGKGLV